PIHAVEWRSAEAKRLIEVAMWASEPVPFDPMEKALHAGYAETAAIDERQQFRMVHEYPLSGKPPMMTHIFRNDAGQRIIAAKGAPEAIAACSLLSDQEREQVKRNVEALAAKGYRVLGVGEANFIGEEYPAEQQQFELHFLGLVAFRDPPKANIPEV